MSSQSTSIRVLASLAASGARLVLSFATGLLIARTLQPSAFGDYSFLLGTFAAMASLLDMGASSAFFTFAAQRPRGRRFVACYAAWLGVQVLTMVGVVILLPDRAFNAIWLGLPRDAVLLALFMAFSMNQLWGFTAQLGESIRDTVGVQIRNLAASLIFLVVVGALATTGLATPTTLFVAGGLLYLTLSLLYGAALLRRSVFPRGEPVDLGEMIRGFAAFCYPSVILASFAYTFLDGYLLQRFGGSTEQGFYGVAVRFASVALLASGAIVQVLWKELAESHARHDTERTRTLLRAFSRGLVFATAVVGCGLAPFSPEVIRATVGAEYLGAAVPFSLMMLYPIYQGLNMTHDVALLATAHTRVRSRIMLAFCLLSLVGGYLALAPRTSLVPGLEAGSAGLAAKVLVSHILLANTAAYFTARAVGLVFDWRHQVYVLLVLLPAGFAAKAIALLVAGPLAESLRGPVVMAVGAALYAAAVLVFVRQAPGITGQSWSQWQEHLRRMGSAWRPA